MIADVRWVIFGFRFCSFGRNVNRLWSLIWAFFINYVTLEGGGWCLKIEINLRMPPWWRLRKVFWDDLWFYCQQQSTLTPGKMKGVEKSIFSLKSHRLLGISKNTTRFLQFSIRPIKSDWHFCPLIQSKNRKQNFRQVNYFYYCAVRVIYRTFFKKIWFWFYQFASHNARNKSMIFSFIVYWRK